MIIDYLKFLFYHKEHGGFHRGHNELLVDRKAIFKVITPCPCVV